MSIQLERAQDAHVIDIRRILEFLVLGRWWILASLFLFTTIFAILAFGSAPTYRASAVLIPASADRGGLGGSLSSALGQLGGLASLAGITVGGGASDTEEALAVLRSRQFTEAFISDEKLAPVLFSQAWDATGKKWKSDTEPPTGGMAYRYFNTKIRSVLQDRKTGLVTLQIDWRDRTEAAEWANVLVKRINAEMRSRAIAKTNDSILYLEHELLTTSTISTRDAINHLIEVQVKQRMLANIAEEYAFRVVDKAMAPDASDPIKPKKVLLLFVGVALGVAVGVVGVLLFGMFVRKWS